MRARCYVSNIGCFYCNMRYSSKLVVKPEHMSRLPYVMSVTSFAPPHQGIIRMTMTMQDRYVLVFCPVSEFQWSCSSFLDGWYNIILGFSYTEISNFGKSLKSCFLTHWGRVTHICVSKLTIIGSDNGLSPERRQAIIWTNAGILLIGPLGTNFSEILTKIITFSFKKMYLKVSSAKWRPFCLGLNVLTQCFEITSRFIVYPIYLLSYCVNPPITHHT